MKTSEPQILGASKDDSDSLHRPAVWVLYFSLFSFYLIVRFVRIGDPWPTREDLQLEVPWAAVGTAILIASSLTMEMARRSSRNRVPRSLLILSLLLGIGFSFVQANEYRQRWLQGLIPPPLSNSLHDRADLFYLSAVQQRLMDAATEINASKVRQNQLAERLQGLSSESQRERSRLEVELANLQAEGADRSERLAVINRLLQSESQWIAKVVATSENFETQRMAIASLAYDIQPHRAFASALERFRELESKQLSAALASAKEGMLAAEASAKESSEPIKQLLDAVAKIRSEQQNLESQLKSHLRKLLIEEENEEAVESTPDPSNDPKRQDLERQLAEVRSRFEVENSKLTAAAKTVTDAEDTAAMLSQEIHTISARQRIVEELATTPGLNRQYPWLHLPICIPKGKAWVWTYFTLTIVHTIHLAYSLAAVLLLTVVARDGSNDPFAKTKQIVHVWHHMVAAWVILFVLIYLI